MSAPTTPPKTFLGTPKLPARYATLVTPFLLTLLMTFVVSLISTLRAVGFPPDFFGIWLGAWGLSWIVAFPTVMVVFPLVRRMTAAIVHEA